MNEGMCRLPLIAATSPRNALFFRTRGNKAEGPGEPLGSQAAPRLSQLAGWASLLGQGHLQHLDRATESWQIGIKEQLAAIGSYEVPNISFIRMNPNLTPIAKRRNKKQDTYFLQADLGALSCCLLSAMSRFDSLPNKIGRACGICQSRANPPIIRLPYRGNRKVLVIRRLTIFLSGTLKIIPHNPEGLTQTASLMWLSITHCWVLLPPGLPAVSGAKKSLLRSTHRLDFRSS